MIPPRNDPSRTGREAYEADRAICPNYGGGGPRPAWEQLDAIAQLSWSRPLRGGPEPETIILPDIAAWQAFATANCDALVETYGSTEKAFRHACDGGLTIGGGAAPLFRVGFVD